MRLAMAAVAACAVSHVVQAQPADSVKTSLYIESRLHHGFIIIHSRDIRAVEDSYPWGFETDIGWHNASQRIWESRAMCNSPR